MKLQTVLLIFLSLLVFDTSFQVKSFIRRDIRDKHDIVDNFKLRISQPQEYDTKIHSPVNMQEFFTPPYADGFIIGITLLGQSLLVDFSMLISFVYSFFDTRQLATRNFGFDSESMTTAVLFALPLLAVALAMTSLPFKVSKEIMRDTRLYALKVLGRNTSFLQAFLLSAVLAGNACHLICQFCITLTHWISA